MAGDRVTSMDDELRVLLVDLLAAASPNPGGDVVEVAEVVQSYCAAAGLPVQVDRPAARRRNLVIDVGVPSGGRHLVWNGHLDTFPAAGPPPRAYAEGGRVYGRGAVDMKGGVAAFLVAAHRLRHSVELPGRLSLVLVCDEETFGPMGARGLLARRPDLYGDALVSTEPSSLGLVRVAERGFLWLRMHFEGRSLHSAYPGGGEGAILRMASGVRAVADLVADLNQRLLPHPAAAPEVAEAMGTFIGPGAEAITHSVSLNVGTVSGGNAVNLQPDRCQVSLDLRVPGTLSTDQVLAQVRAVAEQVGGSVEVLGQGEASRTDPDAEVVRAVASAVSARTGRVPVPSTGLGCTDARLWRQAGVPAVVVGPSPATMGTTQEYAVLSELVDLVHILCESAVTYLTGER